MSTVCGSNMLIVDVADLFQFTWAQSVFNSRYIRRSVRD